MSLVTGKVRFSYVNIFEPRAINGGEEKYSITILISKTDVDTYQRIMAEINKTLQEHVSDVFKGVMPANPSLPLYDGDGLRPSGEPFGAECKGCWVMSAKSNNAPEIVDATCQPIISKNECYSGCYGRVSLRFYAYNQNGNKGIGCGLGNVQKLEDGQPLDGRTTASEDFGGFTPQSQPVYQAPVAQPVQQAAYQNTIPAQNNVNVITGQPMQQQPINDIYGVN